MSHQEEKLKVLIVDDERTNLDILSKILMDDYELQGVKSGEAALKLVAESRPDLILLDVLLPEMSGFEVLAALKEMDMTRNIPVIFITGLSNIGDEEKGLRLGAVDYITKPFHESIVRARVRTHMQIVRYIGAIERLGMIDALTDIPNRRNFDMRIREEWRRACRSGIPFSLLMMDVDQFKIYNDTYGHPQGDVLLQTLAKIFTSCLRRPSDMVARLGGEEFAALLPGTDAGGALLIGEKIRAAVEAKIIPCTGSGVPTSITISVGVNSVIPTAENSLEDFILEADKNLYAAKSAGRNKVLLKTLG